jgi:predicted transcriptional regulator
MFYTTDTIQNEHNTALDAPEPQDERDLEVLAWVHNAQDPKISQRTIAGALGMSLGLTNAILKRLTDKGLLMVRRINQHNAHYLVTPDGIEQISRRSYRYLRRTIGHVVRYKERLRAWCREQSHRGITEIRLLGESDLTFILEWCAQKEGLNFQHAPGGNVVADGATTPPHAGTLIILAESVVDTNDPEAVLLHKVLLGDES